MPNLFVFDYIISICRIMRKGHTAIPEFVKSGYTYHHDSQQPFNLPLARTRSGNRGNVQRLRMGLCVEVIWTSGRWGTLRHASDQHHPSLMDIPQNQLRQLNQVIIHFHPMPRSFAGIHLHNTQTRKGQTSGHWERRWRVGCMGIKLEQSSMW